MQDKMKMFSWRLDSIPANASVWCISAGHLIGGGNSRYHRNPDYFCPHILTKGEGYVKIRDRVVPLKTGDMFTIWPGIEIEYFENPQNTWQFSWIHLDGPGANGYVKSLGFDKDRLTLAPVAPERCMNLFHNILRHCQKKRNGSQFLILSTLYKLPAYTVLHSKNARRNRDLLAEATALTSSPAGLKLNVTELCQALQTSRVTLFREFRERLSISPIEYIDAKRLEKAKRLLLESQYSISDIAVLAGFNSPEYFQRRFKKATGLPPGLFRERMT